MQIKDPKGEKDTGTSYGTSGQKILP